MFVFGIWSFFSFSGSVWFPVTGMESGCVGKIMVQPKLQRNPNRQSRDHGVSNFDTVWLKIFVLNSKKYSSIVKLKTGVPTVRNQPEVNQTTQLESANPWTAGSTFRRSLSARLWRQFQSMSSYFPKQKMMNVSKYFTWKIAVNSSVTTELFQKTLEQHLLPQWSRTADSIL